MKKDFFRLEERGTNFKRELLAGITTFVTMAYVLALQPAALHAAPLLYRRKKTSLRPITEGRFLYTYVFSEA